MIFSNTLLEAIARHAENNPSKVCLIDVQSNRQLTYGEFWKFVRGFAERLKTLGLKQGDRVTVQVSGLLETMVAHFGSNLAGGVYCPVERSVKQNRILEIIEYFESDFFVSTESIDFSGKWINMNELCHDIESVTVAENFAFPKFEDLYAIYFTTGTTGKAKGVMLSQHAHTASSELWIQTLDVNEDSVVLWANPLDRVVCSAAFGSALLAGGTAVYNPGVVFAKDFFETIEKHRVTVISLEPFALSFLLEASSSSFEGVKNLVRTMVFSGSAMPEQKRNQIQKLLPETKICIHYGSTEVGIVTGYEFRMGSSKGNTIGKSVEFAEVYLLDEDGKEMNNTSKNNFGIVSCESESIMMGYWRDEALTSEVLKNNRLIMADVGYMDEDGYVYLAGRRDDVIISGGHKIAPYEIEDTAMQIPEILECVCIATPNPVLGNVPKLFVVMKEGTIFSAKNISEHLTDRLETYKIPRVIEQIDALPRVGETQKINRKALS